MRVADLFIRRSEKIQLGNAAADNVVRHNAQTLQQHAVSITVDMFCGKTVVRNGYFNLYAADGIFLFALQFLRAIVL